MEMEMGEGTVAEGGGDMVTWLMLPREQTCTTHSTAGPRSGDRQHVFDKTTKQLQDKKPLLLLHCDEQFTRTIFLLLLALGCLLLAGIGRFIGPIHHQN